jgi:hypothetical protein
MQTKTSLRLLAASSCVAAAALAAHLSCASGGTTFEPIVIDFSATKTPTPAPVPTSVPPPPPTSAPKPTAAPASVPAVDLTPPPREKPEPPVGASVETPAGVVARQREALDRGDVDAALALYAPTAHIEDGARSVTGRDAIRAFLQEQIRSASPPEGRERVASGAWVAERSATGGPGLVAYEVRDGRIVRVRILR